jgi:hypothetical protein
MELLAVVCRCQRPWSNARMLLDERPARFPQARTTKLGRPWTGFTQNRMVFKFKIQSPNFTKGNRLAGSKAGRFLILNSNSKI